MAALLIVLFPLAVLGYALPGLIAVARRHPWACSIVIVNIGAGWTGLAWLLALAWAAGPIARQPAGPWKADNLPHLVPRDAMETAPGPAPTGRNVVRLSDHRDD